MKCLILFAVLATGVFANVDNSLKVYRVEIRPQGFEVIVPYTPKYQKIYIHFNINHNISYYETAEYIEELKQLGSGPWIYHNMDVILSPGDEINYYFVEILEDGTAYRDSIHCYHITKETPRNYYPSTNKGSFSSVGNGHSVGQTVYSQGSNYQSASQKTDLVYGKDESEAQAETVVHEGVSAHANTGHSRGQADQAGTNKATYQRLPDESVHYVYSTGQTQGGVQKVGQREVSTDTVHVYNYGDRIPVKNEEDKNLANISPPVQTWGQNYASGFGYS